jgi:hypothetical protein
MLYERSVPNGVWYAPSPDYEWTPLGESNISIYASRVCGTITVSGYPEICLNDFRPKLYVVKGIDGVFYDHTVVFKGSYYPTGKMLTLHLPLTFDDVRHVLNNMGASRIELEVRNGMRDGKCYVEMRDYGSQVKQFNSHIKARIVDTRDMKYPQDHEIILAEDY